MINSTNLLALKIQQIKQSAPANTQSATAPQEQKAVNSGLLNAYLNNLAMINTPAVTKTETTAPVNYHNDLKTLFQNNQAKILAIVPRTFNAKDLNGNDYIDGNEQHGTFLNAIERLDEVKASGFNTLHVLPISTPGKIKAMGTAGSVYAPKDMLEIDPTLIDKMIREVTKNSLKRLLTNATNAVSV